MKKVCIIGGGVAGFAAGIYLRANGYDTEIFEKNAVAGGACMGWERQGCYIDGCIHWLTGVAPKSELRKLWLETHALFPDTKIYFQDDLMRMRHSDGTEFTYWADLDKLQAELLALAPEDKKEIHRFVKLIKIFQRVDPPCQKPTDLMNVADLAKVAATMGIPYIWVCKTSKLSVEDYAARFKNKYIRDALADLIAPHYNLMSLLYMLGHISSKDGGIPYGGSLAMANRMEARYLALGGKLRKGIAVQKVLVEQNVAKGVLLKNGESVACDWVVSTVPAEHALTHLLEGRYPDKLMDERLKNAEHYPIYTYTTMVLKCPRRMQDKSLSIKLRLQSPIEIDKPYMHLTFRNYAYDETLKGSDEYCVVQATVHSDDKMYFWWKAKKESGEYKAEKARVAQEMLRIAKSVYPDVADEMEVIDVVTPCTYERYLNSRHGCFQGFIHTKHGKSLMQNGRIKGLKGFILAGQWIVQSGGLPPAVMSGRFAAQRICHDDKKKFEVPMYEMNAENEEK